MSKVNVDQYTFEGPSRQRRAPKDADAKRSERVIVWLTVDESAQLNEWRGKMPRSRWVRDAAFGQPPPTVPAINADAWAELSRLAVSFNQAQAMIRADRQVVHDPSLLQALIRALYRVRVALVRPAA